MTAFIHYLLWVHELSNNFCSRNSLLWSHSNINGHQWSSIPDTIDFASKQLWSQIEIVAFDNIQFTIFGSQTKANSQVTTLVEQLDLNNLSKEEETRFLEYDYIWSEFWEGHKILRYLHSPSYFWLALCRTKVRRRFCKILWPSQNIWTVIRSII